MIRKARRRVDSFGAPRAGALNPEENLLLQTRRVIPPLAAFLLLGLLPTASSAQQPSTYTAGLAVGIGGATDADPSTGYDDFGFQAFFAMEVQSYTQFVTRLGRLSLDSKDSTVDGDLTYLTVAGEYTFNAGSYESGLFLGLGYYDLSTNFLAGDDSALGLTLGTTGDFRLTDRLSLYIELSGHWADLDYAQFFVMGLAGVAYHF